MTKDNSNLKRFALLHLSLLLYALVSVLSKFASKFEFLSFEFVICYSAVMFLLVLYAVLWQQVLKRMKLNVAFANKGITVVWGIVFGSLFFREQVSVSMVVSCVLIIIGIILIVGDENEH